MLLGRGTEGPGQLSRRRAGVPLRDVQVFLGHASPSTTERYDFGRDHLDRSLAYALSEVFS